MLFINQLENTCFLSDEVRKKQNMGDFLLFTTSVAHIPGANISFTVGICDAGLNHSGDWS